MIKETGVTEEDRQRERQSLQEAETQTQTEDEARLKNLTLMEQGRSKNMGELVFGGKTLCRDNSGKRSPGTCLERLRFGRGRETICL